MVNTLPCGHDHTHLVVIDNYPGCQVCQAIDSGNYTYDRTPGTDALATAIEHLADQVQNLAAQIAEQGKLAKPVRP